MKLSGQGLSQFAKVYPPNIKSLVAKNNNICIGDKIELESNDIMTIELQMIGDNGLRFFSYETNNELPIYWQEIVRTEDEPYLEIKTDNVNFLIDSGEIQKRHAIKLISKYTDITSKTYRSTFNFFINKSAPKVIGEQSEEWKEQEILNFE